MPQGQILHTQYNNPCTIYTLQTFWRVWAWTAVSEPYITWHLPFWAQICKVWPLVDGAPVSKVWIFHHGHNTYSKLRLWCKSDSRLRSRCTEEESSRACHVAQPLTIFSGHFGGSYSLFPTHSRTSIYVEHWSCRQVEYLKALPEGLIRTGICCPNRR